MKIIYILIALIAIACIYDAIKKSVRKNTAKRRLRMYPNAVKGVLGFYHKVSLDNIGDINALNAEHHDEKFWQEIEIEEKNRLERCNNIKRTYPNGWESWKQLHPENYEDLHIVDKETDIISELEDKYADFVQQEQWISMQNKFASQSDKQGTSSVECDLAGIDRFGNPQNVHMFITHLFCEIADCTSDQVESSDDYTDTVVRHVKQMNENIVFLISPSNDKHKFQIESLGMRTILISEVQDYSWEKYQTFALLIEVADKQTVKFIGELLFSNLKTKPLLVAISFVKAQTDTEYNTINFVPYSPSHNEDNYYVLDDVLIANQYKGAYYFTIHDQTCRTVKKAISSYFDEFDTDTIAERTSNKYRFSSLSQYYKKSADEIKQMWADKRDESAKCNRKLREDIMAILSNKACDRDGTSKHFDTLNNEWKISPYRTNWPIYDRESGIVATVDCLAYQDGKFILFSWVRTDSALEDFLLGLKSHSKRYVVDDNYKKSIIKSYYNTGKKKMAFENLYDCKFTKYSIEQHVIMYILNKNYGISVDESYIVIMHPKYKNPIAFRPDDVSGEVEQFMITESVNNKSKPNIKGEFGKSESPEVYQNDVEPIDVIELF